ncbi:hypothetical protein OsI_02049 [Oryza sativa Indica Group]|uniref:Uncharacterized protein n=1 Tax=Oryza sativa subsp. indica TaxID=39946 RepID=A2WQC2_ORYSI|nr:hypothetical protein OsI_02049 [Oryza sativa Indica Group]
MAGSSAYRPPTDAKTDVQIDLEQWGLESRPLGGLVDFIKNTTNPMHHVTEGRQLQPINVENGNNGNATRTEKRLGWSTEEDLRLSLQQQNEQLKLENEKLKKKNYAIKLQEFNSICSTCHMRAENACLGTEIQRLYARATNQETEAQPEEVDLPFPPTAGSQEGAPLNQDEPAPPSK